MDEVVDCKFFEEVDEEGNEPEELFLIRDFISAATLEANNESVLCGCCCCCWGNGGWGGCWELMKAADCEGGGADGRSKDDDGAAAAAAATEKGWPSKEFLGVEKNKVWSSLSEEEEWVEEHSSREVERVWQEKGESTDDNINDDCGTAGPVISS